MTWPEATHQPLEGWQADTSSAERDPKALLPSRCDTCPWGQGEGACGGAAWAVLAWTSPRAAATSGRRGAWPATLRTKRNDGIPGPVRGGFPFEDLVPGEARARPAAFRGDSHLPLLSRRAASTCRR